MCARLFCHQHAMRQVPALTFGHCTWQACKVGKLFAKHFKVEEQRADLATRRLAAAVGTPNRLAKLADLGALRLDRLRLIAVDVHLDAKQRCRARCLPSESADFCVLPEPFWEAAASQGLLISRPAKFDPSICSRTNSATCR